MERLYPIHHRAVRGRDVQRQWRRRPFASGRGVEQGNRRSLFRRLGASSVRSARWRRRSVQALVPARLSWRCSRYIRLRSSDPEPHTKAPTIRGNIVVSNGDRTAILSQDNVVPGSRGVPAKGRAIMLGTWQRN